MINKDELMIREHKEIDRNSKYIKSLFLLLPAFASAWVAAKLKIIHRHSVIHVFLVMWIKHHHVISLNVSQKSPLIVVFWNWLILIYMWKKLWSRRRYGILYSRIWIIGSASPKRLFCLKLLLVLFGIFWNIWNRYLFGLL